MAPSWISDRSGVTAKSLFPYCISASVFLQALLLPMLGGIADYTNLKKRLMICCYGGAAATCLLVFVTEGRYLAGGVLLMVANVCFGASLVLYDAFLNDIATDDRRDAVSSRGYAFGYLGGGLLLALNLLLVQGASALGISTGLAVRLSFLSAGLWWGGFAIVTFRSLETRGPSAPRSGGESLFTIGIRELARTWRDSELSRLPARSDTSWATRHSTTGFRR